VEIAELVVRPGIPIDKHEAGSLELGEDLSQPISMSPADGEPKLNFSGHGRSSPSNVEGRAPRRRAHATMLWWSMVIRSSKCVAMACAFVELGNELWATPTRSPAVAFSLTFVII
jgi:hypothetical protein